jgi:hypothetical protein
VEDGGSRVDELRVGGQTQSITVQADGSRVRVFKSSGAEIKAA